MKYSLAILIAAIFALGACNGVPNLSGDGNVASPYDRYLRKLEKAELQERPMVKQWIDAGLSAFEDSLVVNIPYTETGHFLSHEPAARSYRFDARDGQVVTVTGALKAPSDAKIFADLFIWNKDEWKNVASTDSSMTLSYELSRNATCLLRIQPELLVNAYYSVSIGLTPILVNPVSGAQNKSIRSFYGDSRDGGKRSHEGVDIFAKKGTPVIAPARGTISRVGTSRLGGKVVWMYDGRRSHSYYFAHLDSQYVNRGQTVKQGDTIGTVGNTGNARFTPPHLHFGIYQSRSKDPLYFIQTLEKLDSSPIDTTLTSEAFRVTTKKSVLRYGPGKAHGEVELLAKDSFIRVLAQTREYYRVALADNRQGFLPRKDVVRAENGKPRTFERETALMAALSDSTAIHILPANTTAEVLANHGEYLLVRTNEGMEGWVR